LTNSAGTPVHLLLTSGDEPSHVDTRGDATVLDDDDPVISVDHGFPSPVKDGDNPPIAGVLVQDQAPKVPRTRRHLQM